MALNVRVVLSVVGLTKSRQACDLVQRGVFVVAVSDVIVSHVQVNGCGFWVSMTEKSLDLIERLPVCQALGSRGMAKFVP